MISKDKKISKKKVRKTSMDLWIDEISNCINWEINPADQFTQGKNKLVKFLLYLFWERSVQEDIGSVQSDNALGFGQYFVYRKNKIFEIYMKDYYNLANLSESYSKEMENKYIKGYSLCISEGYLNDHVVMNNCVQQIENISSKKVKSLFSKLNNKTLILPLGWYSQQKQDGHAIAMIWIPYKDNQSNGTSYLINTGAGVEHQGESVVVHKESTIEEIKEIYKKHLISKCYTNGIGPIKDTQDTSKKYYEYVLTFTDYEPLDISYTFLRKSVFFYVKQSQSRDTVYSIYPSIGLFLYREIEFNRIYDPAGASAQKNKLRIILA